MKLVTAALIVALGAFVSLSYEILWYRLLVFASGDAASTFGLLLAFYLFGLAVGALAVGALCRRLGPQQGQIQWLGVALFIGLANLIGYVAGPLLGWFAQGGAWQLILPLIAVATALLGGILPLMTHYAVPADERAGARLSILYAANIVGAAAGSFLTGYVLLDALPLRSVALLLAVFGLGMAFLVVMHRPVESTRARKLALSLVVMAVALALSNRTAFDGLYEKLLYKGGFRPGTHFARIVENRVGVIGVTKTAEVFASGVYDGMILTDPIEDRNGIVRAFAVGAMHPRPRRILVIGLGTGAWTQVLAHTPGVEQVTVVEINPGYLDIIAEYAAVASLLRNPRVQIVIDDGRRWLAKNPELRFDAIVANATFNYRSHSTNLMSVEFLQLIRRNLKPGGIYYFNTTGSPHVERTALSVYRYGLRFRNFVAVSDAPIRLNRSRLGELLAEWNIDGRTVFDLSRERDRLRLTALADEEDGGSKSGPEVEDRASILRRTGFARIITDDNMATEWEHVFPEVWLP
jgi:spermidine synthase